MFSKFIKAVIVLWTVTALNLSAQDFSSRWMFGSAYDSKMKATWETEHYLDVSASLKGGWSMGRHLSYPTTAEAVVLGDKFYR